jgi:molecular chaperone DnaJ
VFDLGDLFGQFFSGNARGGRVRVDQVDIGDPRQRGARGPAGYREAQDAEFEQNVKASDGTWLRVEGSDVASDVRISFDRAILGTVATVATIDGKAEVKIPPGTSSGKKLRLRSKGMPVRHVNAGRYSGQPTGEVGDHYVTIQIDVPSDLDDDAKKALIQLVTRLRKRGHND